MSISLGFVINPYSINTDVPASLTKAIFPLCVSFSVITPFPFLNGIPVILLIPFAKSFANAIELAVALFFTTTSTPVAVVLTDAFKSSFF